MLRTGVRFRSESVFVFSQNTQAAEQTDAAHAIMELSLAHTVGSSVEQAYARSDLLEKRRRLMNDWASFVAETAVDVVAKRSELGNK